MTKVRNPARNMWTWRLLLGAVALALCLTAPARTIAGETGSTDEYAGVPITGSVLLDPFDPVPQIQFRRDCGDWGCGRHHCYHECGERWHCEHDCRWHGWYCERECYGPHLPSGRDYNIGWWRCPDECRDGRWRCDHDCRLEGWRCEHDCEVRARCDHECHRDERGDRCLDICYGRLVHEYEERLERSDAQSHRYDEQSHWYFEHVMDRDHHDGGFEHDHFDHDHHDRDHHEDHDHFGPPEPEGPPPGPDPYGPPGPGPGAYGPPGAGPDNGPPQGPGPAYGPAPGSGPYGPPPGPDSGPPPYGSPH